MNVTDVYVALGWLPANEVMPPDAVRVAEHIASVAATLERLEPHVRRALDTSYMATPAPFAAASTLLADVNGAARFDARLFNVVSGRRYRAITNGGVEFSLRPGVTPLSSGALDDLVLGSGMAWRPDPERPCTERDYWSVQTELRARTYAVLHDTDLGQATWQGEPQTRTWAEEARVWPAHLLVQDPFGGVSRPGRSSGWRPVAPRTVVVVGARYSAGQAAAALAEALGWQFVPVRSDVEVTAGGRLFPVARDRVTGRVMAWSSVARHIEQRQRDGDPWQAVVLVRPSALRGRGEVDRFALQLLRNTTASVVYVRPPHEYLAWWAGRQEATAVPGQFNGAGWLSQTESELEMIEQALARRNARDLYLQVPAPPAAVSESGASMPDELVDSQARLAWTVLGWLDDVANRGQPSLRSRLLPGSLATWMPALSTDPDAKLPALRLAA
jgi:hypothetical protein